MYQASIKRYTSMLYRRTGKSGLKLPAISFGLWHNFGGTRPYETSKEIVLKAFDLGITHIDLANNYGPPAGSAEENFGKMLSSSLKPYRDELIISSKAGYYMWPGPYGEWGSRKYITASLDQSLKRMGLDYVDIFYSHRFDPDTPLEETMGALASAVHQGKALYVGVSSYSAKKTKEASDLLKQMGVPCLIHQPSYSMLNRWIEEDLLETLEQEGIGCIAFSPLAQGLLSDRYLKGLPQEGRVHHADSFKKAFLTAGNIKKLKALNKLAKERGQTLAQMALAWALRDARVTSALIGASSTKQLEENIAALNNLKFSAEELNQIDKYATESGINLWEQSHKAG